jgi:acyl CoA:acetate/3-ketoacid CoA transferase
VLYLTERASFRLTPNGIELFEIAPGIDLQSDVLEQMQFTPLIAENLKVMEAAYFKS